MEENRARQTFEAYVGELVTACQNDARIVGLVLMGSTADRSRVDEWSDHDFAAICIPESLEDVRGDLSWLPRSDTLVAGVRELHGGFKAIYQDGAVLEFAITDLGNLRTFLTNAWEVAYGGEPVLEAMRAAEANPIAASRRERDAPLFLAAILIGVGRTRRGEVLSGSRSVRGEAFDYLVAMLAASQSAPGSHRLDTLDPRRRFEFVYPEWGSELITALEFPVEECARILVELAWREELVSEAGVAAVRAPRLGLTPKRRSTPARNRPGSTAHSAGLRNSHWLSRPIRSREWWHSCWHLVARRRPCQGSSPPAV